MEEIPLISFFETIPKWVIGFVCGIIPTVISLWKKQWSMGVFVLLLSIAAGFFGGWLMASWVSFLLFLFAVLSPSSGTGIFSIAVFGAIAGFVLYAIELRLGDIYEKFDLPSLVAIFGEPKGTDSQSKARTYRTYTAPDGRTISARIETFDGTWVTIVRKDGQRFTTTLEKFSEKDQEYIKASIAEPVVPAPNG